MEHIQLFINIALGVAFSTLGWFARELWSAVKLLKDDLAQLREEIANDRVHKDDFKTAIDRLFQKLDRIEDKLDKKADK